MTVPATETSPASTTTPDASSTTPDASSTTPDASSTSSEASATPTASDRPLPETLEDLTPAARELYDFLLAHLPIDADGNVNYNVPAQKVTTLEVAPFDPDNVGKQQELDDMFADSGLDSPADLVAKASSGVAGVCEAPAAAVHRRLLQPSRRVQREIRARSQERNYARWVHSRLQARDSDGWDIACSDMVGGLLGLIHLDEAMETVCNSKDRKLKLDLFTPSLYRKLGFSGPLLMRLIANGVFVSILKSTTVVMPSSVSLEDARPRPLSRRPRRTISTTPGRSTSPLSKAGSP